LGWLKNFCGIALPTSGERDQEINLNGLENYTIGLHSSGGAKYGFMTTMNKGNN